MQRSMNTPLGQENPTRRTVLAIAALIYFPPIAARSEQGYPSDQTGAITNSQDANCSISRAISEHAKNISTFKDALESALIQLNDAKTALENIIKEPSLSEVKIVPNSTYVNAAIDLIGENITIGNLGDYALVMKPIVISSIEIVKLLSVSPSDAEGRFVELLMNFTKMSLINAAVLNFPFES